MKREDDVLVAREEIDESVFAHAVRMAVGRKQRHQIDDVDHAHLHLGQILAKQPRRRDRLFGHHVAGACEHDDQARRHRQLPAHSHREAPREQCSRAASISSHCRCGCLSMTIRLM